MLKPEDGLGAAKTGVCSQSYGKMKERRNEEN
jgi:hypothetical protein